MIKNKTKYAVQDSNRGLSSCSLDYRITLIKLQVTLFISKSKVPDKILRDISSLRC